MEDERLAAQHRLIAAMQDTASEPKAEYARELVMLTPHLAASLAEGYLPEADAVILSREKAREMFAKFAEELACVQADWLGRWDKAKKIG